MQFMFSYPQWGFDGDMLEAGAITDVARTAEAAGWDGLAFTDHPAPGAKWLQHGGHQSLDPFVALGNAAAVTSTLKLHTHLAVAPYRNPLLLAKSAATVDKLSNGRLILGLGAGYHKKEFKALGVDFDERNALFDEMLEVMPMHWRGESFSFEGLHFTASEVIGRPPPVQQPIPIWIGGNSQRSLRRVAEKAQGWIPLIGPKEMSSVVRTPVISELPELREKIQQLQEMSAHRDQPLDILMPYLDRDISSPDADVARHKDKLAELEAMGISWVFIPGLEQHPDADAVRRYLETAGKHYCDS